MEAVCDNKKKNIGAVRCTKMPGLPRTILTTNEDFEIPNATLEDPAALETYLQNALIAGLASRAYLWPFFVGFENVSEDAIYEESALADIKVRDGKYRHRAMIQKNLCIHKAMFTHRANDGRAFVIDTENQMTGTMTATGMRGRLLSLLNTEKLMLNDGTVSTKSPIYLVFADSTELDKNGGMVDVPFINTLKRLTDVKIELVEPPAPTDSSIRVKVSSICDGTPINGLLVADFVGTDAAGDPIVIATAPPVAGADGTYTLTGAAVFEDDGTITLRAASLLTVKAYEVPTEGVLTLAGI